jgi:hypothetical protein
MEMAEESAGDVCMRLSSASRVDQAVRRAFVVSLAVMAVGRGFVVGSPLRPPEPAELIGTSLDVDALSRD